MLHKHTHTHKLWQNRDVNISSPFLSLSFALCCWSSTHIGWSSNQWAARSKSIRSKLAANHSSLVLCVWLILNRVFCLQQGSNVAQGMIKCTSGKDVLQASVWKLCVCMCLWWFELITAGYRGESHWMRAIKGIQTFISLWSSDGFVYTSLKATFCCKLCI